MQTVFRIIKEQVKQNALDYIKELPLNAYKIVICELKRSNEQNALMWIWVTQIANHFGSKDEEIIMHIFNCSAEEAAKIKRGGKDYFHNAFKRNFIGTESGKDMFGNLYINPKSSAKLKKKEFSEYMSKIQMFAHQQGIKLPQPDYYGME